MKSLKQRGLAWLTVRTRHVLPGGESYTRRSGHIGLVLTLAAFGSCQSASSDDLKPMPAAALAAEYARAKAEFRSRYDGKEVVVRGYVSGSANMPHGQAEQGSLSLDAQAQGNPESKVTCWFSNDQQKEFATIPRGKYVTVKGVFNGEGGMDLKFCRVIRVE